MCVSVQKKNQIQRKFNDVKNELKPYHACDHIQHTFPNGKNPQNEMKVEARTIFVAEKKIVGLIRKKN